MNKTAIIIGATGLIGNELLNLLLHDEDFLIVKIFVRKPIALEHQKLKQLVVDFSSMEPIRNEINGDIVFCCIGSTMKKSGSKEAFIKVDFEIPIDFAKYAKANGVKQFALVSSLGANEKSSNFYLHVKGRLENELIKIDFKSIIIARPSMLLGDRKEFRIGELIGKVMMQLLTFLFVGKLKKYKAIHVRKVAKAMILASKNATDTIRVLESDELQVFGS